MLRGPAHAGALRPHPDAGQGFLGHHVVIQSCRGTGGSGGSLEPFTDEAADGQATVAWLREQPWFNGELATIGASYLGFVQWALAADPPPELRAMIVQVSSDDFRRFLYPGGALALESILTGVVGMLSFERGFPRFLLATARLMRRYRRVERTLPLNDAYPPAFGQRVGFLDDWLAHPDEDDPYWVPRRAAVKTELVPPVSLLGGWWDVCLDPTLDLYRRLRDAGREVRLTVGPWNHTSGFSGRPNVPHEEAVRWLRAHTGDGGAPGLQGRAGIPGPPVRVHVGEIGGPGEWRDLPDWPPPDAEDQQWHLHGAGFLARTPPDAKSVSRFRYGPAKPTPAVGGPRMDSRGFGARRNDKLESRGDVLTVTSEPLEVPLEVIGPVGIRLRVRASGPCFDLFARLCDVDGEGHSWNVCDGLLRFANSNLPNDSGDSPAAADPPGEWADVAVPMSATAHRFRAGHRLRVQVSGGAHPRFMRNTGSGEPPGTATRLVPVDIEFAHGPGIPGVLSVPVAKTA
ncbi:MAG: CocE/NonD family hydrolase [Trebonia sp.]